MRPTREQFQSPGAIRRVCPGLCRDSTHTRHRPRHDGADREELALRGDAELLMLGVPGHDGKRRGVIRHVGPPCLQRRTFGWRFNSTTAPRRVRRLHACLGDCCSEPQRRLPGLIHLCQRYRRGPVQQGAPPQVASIAAVSSLAHRSETVRATIPQSRDYSSSTWSPAPLSSSLSSSPSCPVFESPPFESLPEESTSWPSFPVSSVSEPS